MFLHFTESIRIARGILSALFLMTTCHATAAEQTSRSRFIENISQGVPQRVVLYGTSLTAKGAWVGQLRDAVEKAYPGKVTWINSGGSGKASDWGVANLREKVIRQKPDTVFIEFSMNDAATTLDVSREQARANLAEMVKEIRTAHPACEIILQLMNPVDRRENDSFSPRPDLPLYQQDYRDFAASEGLLCVDHMPAFMSVLEKGSDAYREFVPDGVHPSAEGFARFLTPTLLQAIGLNSGGLMGNRFLTLNTIVRVRQIEVTRDTAHGPDESSVHTPAEARRFREAIEKAWPGARITWAFSWLALHDERENYRGLRELVVGYQKQFGDEITFIPGAYFSNMYNAREQVNRDLHEGLRRVSEIVGGGYRPKSVVAGFLSADNLRYLAEKEGIHVCQGNIWSQYAVDNGDGEGSICYPYFPSREHFCKPSRGAEDFIDIVNLDGWTVDFLCARIAGSKIVDGERWRSRQGVGPIETLLDMGTERGHTAMMAATASHFDDGFRQNGFAWVTNGWEMSLVEARKIYGYGGRNGMEGLHLWLTETRKRWPDAKLITQGEFGELWRAHAKNNDQLNYRFTHRGCGIRASEADKEIRWFMNRDFRLALLRDWKKNEPPMVIDFTRYDLPAMEPADPEGGEPSRNWSLMNRINQKGSRPEDKPVALGELPAEEQALIIKHYPELFAAGNKAE